MSTSTEEDAVQYSVSGFSSGGFFVVQYSVAFSSEIIGTGVVAGGAYYCAQNEAAIAEDECMQFPEGINVDDLVSKTKEFADKQYIDSTDNIANQKVYLYSGTSDSVVKSGSVEKCQQYYQDFKATTQYKNDIASEHAMVTNSYGSECGYKGEPYINNCNFDLAGTILQYIYNNTLKQGMNSSLVPYNNVISIDQSRFMPNGKTPQDISMEVEYKLNTKTKQMQYCTCNTYLFTVRFNFKTGVSTSCKKRMQISLWFVVPRAQMAFVIFRLSMPLVLFVFLFCFF